MWNFKSAKTVHCVHFTALAKDGLNFESARTVRCGHLHCAVANNALAKYSWNFKIAKTAHCVHFTVAEQHPISHISHFPLQTWRRAAKIPLPSTAILQYYCTTKYLVGCDQNSTLHCMSSTEEPCTALLCALQCVDI